MSAALQIPHAPTAPQGQPSADRDLQGLYERNADRILAFCRRRLATQQEAEDAMQTTFLHALRALRRGVVPISEAAWLFKIAENVCFSTYRSNGRRSEHESLNADLVEAAPAREDKSETLFGLEEALASIPESQRLAFVLRDLRGLSYEEIAVTADVSVSAVATLVFRARRSLARALDGGAGLKGRLAGVLDLAAVANVLKTVFGGAAAAKIVAASTVLAVSLVPAGDSGSPLPGKRPATVRAEQARPAGRQAPEVLSAAARREDDRSAGPATRPSSGTSGDGATAASRSSRPGPVAPSTPVVPPSANEPAPPAAPSAPDIPQSDALVPPATQLPTEPRIEAPGLPVPPVNLPPVNLPALLELPQAPQSLEGVILPQTAQVFGSRGF